MIQIFRALSIIAVVMIHTIPSAETQILYRPFINFSVAAFIFLSGYLTRTENDNWYTFYKKRIIRVIFPYIIWTIVYTLITNKLANGGGDFCLIAKNLLTAKAAATMYYILVYIQFVLLTPLLGILAKSKYRHLGWLVAPLATLIFKYYYLFTGTTPNTYISLFWSNVCLGWFTFYYLGLLLGNKIIKANYPLKIMVPLYFLSILVQVAEGYGWWLMGASNVGTQIKFSSFITSTLFLLIVNTILNRPCIDIKNRFLRSLGDYSFGIYLSHILVIMILERIPIYSGIMFPVNSVIVVLTSWIFCYCGYRICGKKLSGWLGLK